MLAAWAIFGVELDVFQRVRLRLMWGVPELIDDSGISTGKTEMLWIWAQLRCILLPQPWPYPQRVVGIYYPSLGSAQANFAPKYEKYTETSAIFRDQLRPTHGKKLGYQALNGAIQWVYRNGCIVQCPAADYANDSQNQASRRFHDGGIDEAKEADAKSQGLDAQILGRVTAPGYNNANPIWANHIVLMGHAEDRDSHPFYRRVRAFKALIGDGSQNNAIITSNYKDWTGAFVKAYRPDTMIRRAKLSMTKARFEQQWGGYWSRGSADWYDSKDLKAVCTRKVPVFTQAPRGEDGLIFTLGCDFAPGRTNKADFNSMVAIAAKELSPGTRDGFGVWRHDGRVWRLWPCWANQMRGRAIREITGTIHRSHQRFGFSRIVFDPGGGGLWAQKDMWQARQIIDGMLQTVTGICAPETAHEYPMAQPILLRFARGVPELMPAWEEQRFLTSDEGPIESIHRTMQALFATGGILWPADADERPAHELYEMDRDTRLALDALTITRAQFATIATLVGSGRSGGSDQEPMLTRRGFLRFDTSGKRKKDLCYACIYAVAGMLSLLKDPEFHEKDGPDGGQPLVMVG